MPELLRRGALLLGLAFSLPVTGEIILEGDAVQGGLVFGQAPPGTRLELDGESVPLTSGGRFVLGFGRDETALRSLVARLPDGEVQRRSLQPSEREFDIQHIDGLPPEQVTPPPEVLERIRAEAERVRRARDRRDDRADFAGGFIWPAEGPVTGVYGSQRILNGEPRNPHWGIDIAAPTGTPVRAPAAGLVTLAEPELYFSGGTILLDHGLGLSSAFLHLSALHVEPGQRVEQGDVIGEIGATGRATGPHLDWRMNLGETRVDPQLLLPPQPADDPN